MFSIYGCKINRKIRLAFFANVVVTLNNVTMINDEIMKMHYTDQVGYKGQGTKKT